PRWKLDCATSKYPLEAGNLVTDKEASRKGEGGARLFELNKEADRILLAKYAPVAVVINEDMEVLQSRGHVGLYLELAPGRANLNVLKMAREGLLFDLQAAINKAKKEGVPVRKENVEVGGNGELKGVNFEVIPLNASSTKERHLLIMFEDAQPPDRSESADDMAKEGRRGNG